MAASRDDNTLHDHLQEITANLLLVTEKEAKLILKAIRGSLDEIPKCKYPSLKYLNAEQHYICISADWMRTFLTVISRDRANVALKDLTGWFSSARGRDIVPTLLPALVLSTFCKLGMCPESIVALVDMNTIILEEKGICWIAERSGLAFEKLEHVPQKSALLRLGRWGLLPGVVVSPQEQVPPDISLSATTPFIEAYMHKAFMGGPWLDTIETKNLATQNDLESNEFHIQFFNCMWEGQRELFEVGEPNRTQHEKVLDYAWRDTCCLPFPRSISKRGDEKETDNDDVELVNIPWYTYAYHDRSNTVIKQSALLQLALVTTERNINTGSTC